MGTCSSTEQLTDLGDAGLPVVALLAEESQAPLAWGSGVRGLLFRDADVTVLVAALQGAAQGLVVCSPELAIRTAPVVGEGGVLSLPEPLTSREMEVLRLLANGFSNKAMAHRLEVTEHTVKFHLNAIMGKLGVQSRTEAVVVAARLGLVSL